MRTASGTDTLSAALALASDGNKVFPFDGKILFRGTRGLKDASMTQQGVRELWARQPWSQNIRLSYGRAASSGL